MHIEEEIARDVVKIMEFVLYQLLEITFPVTHLCHLFGVTLNFKVLERILTLSVEGAKEAWNNQRHPVGIHTSNSDKTHHV